MTEPVALGIDIGGTRLRVAAVTAGGDLQDRVRRATPAHDPETLLADLAEVIDAYPRHLPVGIGIAGLVTIDGVVRYGPNIGIRDLPLGSELGARVGRPVLVLNDGSAATLAEQRIGAGLGSRDVVMLTVGTGIGGGVMVDGRLVLGRSGYAGEIGHLIVEEGGRTCPCGNRGCVEAYASGASIGRVASERLADGTDASSLRDVDPVDGRAISQAAVEGDAFARNVLASAGHWLGVAAAGVVNLLDPDVVLLGGGASATTADWMVPAARRAMQDRLVGSAFRDAPELHPAVLGDDAGTVGAAMFAAEHRADLGASP